MATRKSQRFIDMVLPRKKCDDDNKGGRRCQGDAKTRPLRVTGLIVLASLLLVNSGVVLVSGREEGLRIPEYGGWQLEEEATTYRPGTDLQFYALELKSYINPQHLTDKVVELRWNHVLYVLYYYRFKEKTARWDIYMDTGFADVPCGFFDPKGKATGRYVRIALTCLRDTERIDIRSGR